MRLGLDEILSTLGAGGMVEVYRAHDAKLNRDVAIKVLLPAVANDPDRLARFSRQPQVLASLSHTHIAQVFGLDSQVGQQGRDRQEVTSFLVMELVDGEELAPRIVRGQLPLDEALPIAKQIAEALAAAHEQGIIRRDLKPANIKVRPDGTVQVLDFGLAKAMEPAGQSSSAKAMNSPTLSLDAMPAGIILGTAAYMSPEQARGSTVDKHADVWAFGVVLYAMLAGAQLFERLTVSDTLAAVLRADPDWSKLPTDTPIAIRRVLRRCLETDPKKRARDNGDVWLEIGEAQTTPAGERLPTPAATAPAPRSRERLAWILSGVLALAPAILAPIVSCQTVSEPPP